MDRVAFRIFLLLIPTVRLSKIKLMLDMGFFCLAFTVYPASLQSFFNSSFTQNTHMRTCCREVSLLHSWVVKQWIYMGIRTVACPLFEQQPCVYFVCYVGSFRGSWKIMAHSKAFPSCGNITHIWQCSWTMSYPTVIRQVWYGNRYVCFT
jgi:hypothetical protein